MWVNFINDIFIPKLSITLDIILIVGTILSTILFEFASIMFLFEYLGKEIKNKFARFLIGFILTPFIITFFNAIMIIITKYGI